MNNDLYYKMKDYLFDEVGINIIRTETLELYCEIADYLYDEINITYHKDGDVILDGTSECLQPWFEWRAHKEYGERQRECQATFYIFVDGDTFEVVIMECGDYDFEYRFNIPMGLTKEEFLKRFVVEMYKVEHKWNEYCDEIDAEQEED